MNLKDRELLLSIARASIDLFGSVKPVIGLLSGGIPPASEDARDWTRVKKVCPQCQVEKPIMPGFGLKLFRGKMHPQSWCRGCRGAKDYRKLAPTYNLKG